MSTGSSKRRVRIASLALSFLLAATSLSSAVERPRFGGSIVVAGEHDLGLDLAPAELRTPIGRTVARALYSTLFRSTPEDRVVPHLLARGQSSREGREWILELVAGARFHDGSPVTSEDVVATLERWARTSPGGAEGCLEKLGEDDDAVRVLAEGASVRVLLAEPCPRLDLELADPAAGILPSAQARADGPLSVAVGSGPFRLPVEQEGAALDRASRAPGGALLLEAFEEHFEGRPFLDRVEIRTGLAGPERRTELRIGALDVALGARLESGEGAEWTGGGVSTVFLVANPETLEESARSEIASKVDRALIAEVILGGGAERAERPLPPRRVPYGPLVGGSQTPSDLEPVRGRPPRSVELAVALEDRPLDLVAQRLQADLDALGLEVRLVRVKRDQLAWSMRSGSFGLVVVERSLPDGSPLWSFGRVIETWRPSPGSRAVDLARSAAGAPGVALGLQALLLAERALVEDAVWIPVVHRELGASHGRDIHVGAVRSDGSLELESIWRRPR